MTQKKRFLLVPTRTTTPTWTSSSTSPYHRRYKHHRNIQIIQYDTTYTTNGLHCLTNSQLLPLLLLLPLPSFLVFRRWTVYGLVGVTLLRTPVYPRPSRRRAFSSSAPPPLSWLPSETRSLPISWHRLRTFLPSLGPAVVSKVVSMPKALSLR